MPNIDGNYIAPTWHNGASPAINAAELQAISDKCEDTYKKADTLSNETATLIDSDNPPANPDEAFQKLNAVLATSLKKVATYSTTADVTFSGYTQWNHMSVVLPKVPANAVAREIEFNPISVTPNQLTGSQVMNGRFIVGLFLSSVSGLDDAKKNVHCSNFLYFDDSKNAHLQNLGKFFLPVAGRDYNGAMTETDSTYYGYNTSCNIIGGNGFILGYGYKAETGDVGTALTVRFNITASDYALEG